VGRGDRPSPGVASRSFGGWMLEGMAREGAALGVGEFEEAAGAFWCRASAKTREADGLAGLLVFGGRSSRRRAVGFAEVLEEEEAVGSRPRPCLSSIFLRRNDHQHTADDGAGR